MNTTDINSDVMYLSIRGLIRITIGTTYVGSQLTRVIGAGLTWVGQKATSAHKVLRQQQVLLRETLQHRIDQRIGADIRAAYRDGGKEDLEVPLPDIACEGSLEAQPSEPVNDEELFTPSLSPEVSGSPDSTSLPTDYASVDVVKVTADQVDESQEEIKELH